MNEAVIKQQILDAGRIIVGSRNLSPDNKAFHKARYSLYGLAALPLKGKIVSALHQDLEVRAVAEAVFPLSCEAGVQEECERARAMLADPDLSFQSIYDGYYGTVYETLMKDEMAWFASQAAARPVHVAYIGGGALPIPAMLMAKRYAMRVTIVDPHTESCSLAMALLRKIGLSHLVSVMNCGGEDADYGSCNAVWVANWIADKQPVFQRVGQFANVMTIVARSAPKESLSFIINDEVDNKLGSDDFALLHTTPRHDDISLVSLIFGRAQKLPDNDRQPESHTPPVVVDNMTDLIGNTPMLRLDPAKTGLKNITLYAKLEHLNPFGSVKDRTAYAMLVDHIEAIAAEGREVLELSSGNAARALQAIASIHGSRLETVSNRIRVDEMRKILQLQGARITPIDDVADPNDAYSALNIVDTKAVAEAGHYFYTDQYRNPANDGTHYASTGHEIVQAIGSVDYMIGSVGTAGSTMGISRCVMETNPDLKMIGVVSNEEDFIPGIRHKNEIFNVGPFREDYYERITGISAQDAIQGVIDLARDYGVMAGPSSGAAYIAALDYLREIDAAATGPQQAVFVVCDRVELYLSYIEARRPDLFI